MKKVAAILMNKIEEGELVIPVDLMRRAGINVDIITVENEMINETSHSISIKADKNLDEVNFDEYDAIFLPGGPSTNRYLEYTKITDTLIRFNENKEKHIITICAAPTILAKLNLLKGRDAICYPSMSNILVENGANYLGKDKLVLKTDNILMGRSVSASLELGLLVVESLLSKEDRRKLEEQIVY